MLFLYIGVLPPDLYDNDAGNLAAVVPVPPNDSIPRSYLDIPSVTGRKTIVHFLQLYN